MRYRNLGNSGLLTSVVGLGGNNFGRRMNPQQTEAVIRQAVDLGINFIDTADIYGGGLSEEYVGRALKGIQDQVLVATKFGMFKGKWPNETGASRKHIVEQVEKSLRKLGRDHIDLYQVHQIDPNTPIEETLRTLDDLVRQGKVLYIGCSNFSAWQTCEAVWTSRALNLNAFVSVQPEYSMLVRDVEQELVPFCMEYRLGMLPYFPLARGFLTGKYRPDEPPPEGTRLAGDARNQERLLTERNFAMLARLERFAQDRGHSVTELAIAWLLGNPVVGSVIAGATTPEQVAANARASEWELSADDLAEVNMILQ